MQIHRFQRTVLAAVLALLTLLLYSGHGQPTDKPEAVFTGQLTDLDIDRMTMTVQALPLTKIFGIAPDCEVITKTKPQASLEDLKIGDEVEVTYQDMSGTLIAHRIVQRNETESGARVSPFLPTESRYLFFRFAVLYALLPPGFRSVS
jgi:Cu/Ag efflux protein CusF